MSQLKPLSKDSIPHAIERAEQYRRLNQPWQAESICRDILAVQADHMQAKSILLLAITDQFGTSTSGSDLEARELCDELQDEYQRTYYSGLIEERLGKAALKRATPRAKYIAYEYYRSAMEFYEQAEKIHPEGNEESIFRWNACVRTIEEFKMEPSPSEDEAPSLLE